MLLQVIAVDTAKQIQVLTLMSCRNSDRWFEIEYRAANGDTAYIHGIEAVTEHFPLSKVNEALNHLREGKARYRIVLENDLG